MPELPEVESLRIGLAKNIIGSTILNIEIRNEKIIAGKGTTRKINKNKTKEFIEKIKNKKIINIERRAKNLIINLQDKNKKTGGIILIHLKMTGQLVFKQTTPSFLAKSKSHPFVNEGEFRTVIGGHPIQESEKNLPHKHTYIIFKLNNGTLYYNDVRQFGYVLYYNNEQELEKERHFNKIGLEPFDKNFTEKYFKTELQKHNSPIKKILLDQKIVVGCGNIYCDEILWHSEVLPTRLCNNLNKKEIESIYNNIKTILQNAINAGGSSVANYLLSDGSRGNYADFHKAYKKTNQQCAFIYKNKKQCKGIIKKINLFGRGTHFCNRHQT